VEGPKSVKLLGVDVGFSKTRDTTGIARLDGRTLDLWKAGTSWKSRKARIPVGFKADFIAVDGPLLPQGVNELVRRRCEFLFIRALFSKRCKPGLSHFGFGLKLRRAAAEACAQFSNVLVDSIEVTRGTLVSSSGPVFESFPNAFLAVLLPEKEFLSAPTLRRGQRFDWLYERAFGTRRLTSTLSKRLDLPGEVWDKVATETDHERRAALVCLLTAAFAAQGTAQEVGDTEGGWFWLPPMDLWQEWAKEGLSQAEEKLAKTESTHQKKKGRSAQTIQILKWEKF
jgi:hypothetical protein